MFDAIPALAIERPPTHCGAGPPAGNIRNGARNLQSAEWGRHKEQLAGNNPKEPTYYTAVSTSRRSPLQAQLAGEPIVAGPDGYSPSQATCCGTTWPQAGSAALPPVSTFPIAPRCPHHSSPRHFTPYLHLSPARNPPCLSHSCLHSSTTLRHPSIAHPLPHHLRSSRHRSNLRGSVE